jgi:hypothetical protein
MEVKNPQNKALYTSIESFVGALQKTSHLAFELQLNYREIKSGRLSSLRRERLQEKIYDHMNDAFTKMDSMFDESDKLRDVMELQTPYVPKVEDVTSDHQNKLVSMMKEFDLAADKAFIQRCHQCDHPLLKGIHTCELSKRRQPVT